MYLLIVALPFVGSAVAGFRGRALGATGAQLITTVCLFLTASLSIVAFYEVALCRSPVTVSLGTWVDSDPLHVTWSLLFDDLTVAILLPVVVVSSLVHLYSMNYMADDPHTPRFFSYLSLFTAFMLLLVAGDSYLVLFLGCPTWPLHSLKLHAYRYMQIHSCNLSCYLQDLMYLNDHTRYSLFVTAY